MSVLSIIVSHCKLHALAVPSSVVGSTDTQTIQLQEILSEIISEITTESKFNVTTQEAVFSCKPVEDQGALQTLAPYGYQYAIFETFFDRTQQMPLQGPLTESEWQQMKALPTAGAWFKYRIKNDHLLLNPIPSAPFHDIAFEYMSCWAVKSAAGVLKSSITADDDTFVFPENILKRGLMFRWKQIKGLPYQADETRYYELLNNYIARDKVKRRIDVANPQPIEIKPGIFVPTTNAVS